MSELQLLREFAEGRIGVEELKDEFEDLFKSSHTDSVKLCTKGIVILTKDIAKAEHESDPKTQIAMYKKALRHAKQLRTEARKIPKDRWTDYVIRSFYSPMSNLANFAKAIIVEKDVKNMTRNDVLDKLDILIDTLEMRIEALEKKVT